jgi:endonuclease-3
MRQSGAGDRLYDPRIAVDIHVQRVTNRWAYVREANPEKTMQALKAILPRRYRGRDQSPACAVRQTHLHRRGPPCSTCPLLDMCRQVGVTTNR